MSVRLRVVDVIEETADARSIVLEAPTEAADRFVYRPGQFLTVRVPHAEGDLARCYSLASDPGGGEPMKMTVKRVVDGRGSNWLCDQVEAGAELEVLPPSGVFTPAASHGDLLLVAGGSGITPVMSILKAALRGDARVALFYANRDPESVIFRAELDELAARHPDRVVATHWLESDRGLPSAGDLAAWAGPHPEREAFVCGPERFMALAEQALAEAGLPRSAVHVERFVSLEGDPFAAPSPGTSGGEVVEGEPTVEVTLDGETRTLGWQRETPLLDVLLAAGLEAPYSCREGSCSACTCLVLDGEVKLLRNTVLGREDLEDGYTLACQAVPLTDDVRVTYE
ncbi:2Fe-2S iron-sulfur cluster-binding protein [Nocardioides sp. NPDC059952]|uniref:2Fe-2S iron-sulfur cluster-binding protein n=1 Tax=Nocardioides sp. NPDC059952 TaxID=3347014 RepID=UPI0036603526